MSRAFDSSLAGDPGGGPVTPALYISHGADGEWFIVEPRDAPGPQVTSLLRAGRTVYELAAAPFIRAEAPIPVRRVD